MCFSANASFAASGILFGIGILTLRQVQGKNELLLASVPCFFAYQQLMEGFIWLNMHHWANTFTQNLMMYSFLVVAYVIWPILFPIASYYVEPNPNKRQWIKWMFLIGLCVAAGSLLFAIKPPMSLHERSLSIHYQIHVSKFRYIFALGYLIATCGSLLISSYRTLQLYAVATILFFLITILLWYINFTSVWCFFGAILSLILYFHFRYAKRLPRR